MDVDEEMKKPFSLEVKLEAYASFFDTTWARTFSDLTRRTKLEKPAMDLYADWHGAASTFRLPWIMMMYVDEVAKAFMQSNEPFWEKLAAALTVRLTTDPSVPLSNMKRKELTSLIKKISGQVKVDMKNAPPAFNIMELWQKSLENSKFQLALWSSQRLCYSAVYFAYENFLRRCVEIGMSLSDYRPKRDKLKADLNTMIGDNVGGGCLDDPKVEIARLVRDSLTHNGGEVSGKLAAKPHGFVVADDRVIQIMPDDTKALFDLLKRLVTDVAERALRLPQFKAVNTCS